MVFEFESLSAVDAFEPSEDCGLVVRDHVSLQPIHVGEILLANLATLQEKNHQQMKHLFSRTLIDKH